MLKIIKVPGVRCREHIKTILRGFFKSEPISTIYLILWHYQRVADRQAIAISAVFLGHRYPCETKQAFVKVLFVIVKFEFVNTEITVLLDAFGLVAVKFSFEISDIEILVVTVLNTSLAFHDPGDIP